jgi:hypothetical protein
LVLANTAKRFDTRENAAADFRPVLTVDYTPVPGPSAIAIIAAGVLSARSRNRRLDRESLTRDLM